MSERLPYLRSAIFAIVLIPRVASGHVLDEYLQATLIVIEPGDIRLKINLTPGVEIADKVLNRIDRDSDGTITNDEFAAYAQALNQDLTVRLNGRQAQLQFTASSVPELVELRSGHGIMQMEFSLTACSFPSGTHRLAFENRHFEPLAAYLVNAARPRSPSIRIARQTRNANQSKSEIEFAYAAEDTFSLHSKGIFAIFAVIMLGVLASLRRFMKRPTNAPVSHPNSW